MSQNPLDMTFVRVGMGYAGIWDKGGVEMQVDHLRRRSGEIHAELSVSAAVSAAGQGALHRASFNVSSTAARDKLARALTERSRTPLPWADYVEDFCAAIIKAERQGEPIIVVGALPPAKAEGYLIDPFLPEGKASIIFAPGGVGKSYLAVLCAVAVASGTDILGMKVQRGAALYLDWETDQYELDERVKRVSAGLGIKPPDVLYRTCAGPLDSMAESLSETVTREGVRLVVVDSVAMASTVRNEGSSAEDSAIQLFSALRYIGATALLIDHVAGSDAVREGAILKPYGSIYKMNLARSVWELKGAPGNPGEDTHIALFHRKVNKGSLQGSIGLVVRHDGDEVSFHREVITDSGLTKGLTLSVRISRVLTDGKMHVHEIAEELDVPEGTVRVTLNRGRNTLFVRLPDESWGLLVR